jgi:hypothetical protein
VNGGAHGWPLQHGCPLPPQVPQSPVPQLVPLAQTAQETPPLPQAPLSLPFSHDDPLQQPAQEVPSHKHAPDTHRCPVPQLPLVHTAMQPSLAPHALLLQSGVHGFVPQTFCPPPPQVWPTLHPPQSMSLRHESRSWPHLPAHSAVSSATHPMPGSASRLASLPPSEAPWLPSGDVVASSPASPKAAGWSKSAPSSDAQPAATATDSATASVVTIIQGREALTLPTAGRYMAKY